MPAVNSTPQYLLASNLSAVYVKTQTSLGVWDDPTPAATPPATGYVGTNAIRVVGTPKWSVRGAGLIQRADQNTPWGGNQSTKTGGIGWDITLTTELYYQLGAEAGSLEAATQLAPLFRASPWRINYSSYTELMVQPLFLAAPDRSAYDFAVQPFSLVYEETGGKRFEAYDCVCVPKLSWEYGQRVMIEWTIKGKWRDVVDSRGVQPVYPSATDQPPIVGVNAALQLPNYFDMVNAVSKVTVDTGWAISDVADFRETYGFGLGFIALAASPSIEVDVADLPETQESDWGYAKDNTIFGDDLLLVLDIGGYTINFTLYKPQVAAFPTPGELNSYRTNTVKFQGIPDNTASVMIWFFQNT